MMLSVLNSMNMNFWEETKTGCVRIEVVHKLYKMKDLQLIAVLLFAIFVLSCNHESKKTPCAEKSGSLDPEVAIRDLESDFIKWWTYHSANISLTLNFTGLNEQSDTIDKGQFLEKLTTGNYIPLKIKSDDKTGTYKLFKLDASADPGIGSTIKKEALVIYTYFTMEGLPFPEFNFTDLNGNVYSRENTMGKILILKTWFIHCAACVAEFPELNEFVEKYKQRNDLIFLSLALDSKAELADFLRRKDFKYPVVSEQRAFIENKLKLQIYPTHIIVDKNGIIQKVVNKASEVILYFENEMNPGERIAPPPPPPPSLLTPPPPPSPLTPPPAPPPTLM